MINFININQLDGSSLVLAFPLNEVMALKWNFKIIIMFKNMFEVH